MTRIKQIMTSSKMKKTNSVTILAIFSALIIVSSSAVGYAYACSPTSGNHCYAVAQRTVSNDGNKETVTASNLTVPNCNTDFTNIPQWIILNTLRTDWIEVGIGTGLLAGSCQTNDIIYTYSKLNNVGTWGTHGTTTAGTDYTFSLDDTTTNTTWVIKKGTTTLRTIPTSYSNGKGETGAEQTHNSSTSIPVTHLKDISYYNGGWNLWTSNVNLPTPNSPLWRYVCTFSAYHHIHVGSGTQQAC